MDTAAGAPAVTVREAGPEQRPVIERLVQLYRHDMSEFLGHLPRNDGLFTFRQLPLFFSEPDRRALLIHHGPTLAGFALTRLLPDGATSISAFFVVRALRRHGVGLRAALELLRSRPGPWAIAFQQANTGVGRFWRQVAGVAVGTAWSEEQRPVPPPAPPGLPPDVRILLDTGTPASSASTSAPASG